MNSVFDVKTLMIKHDIFCEATKSISVKDFNSYIAAASSLNDFECGLIIAEGKPAQVQDHNFCLVKREGTIRPIVMSLIIASGAFKQVALARDCVNSEVVVCMRAFNKESNSHLAAEYRNSFLVQESEAFTKVVGFYQSPTNKSSCLLAEFGGCSLAHYLSSPAHVPLSRAAIIHIAYTITDALLFLAKKNLVYTDLKLRNMLSHNLYDCLKPTVKICDLESIIVGKRTLTYPEYLGTIGYHLPEHDEYLSKKTTTTLITKDSMGWSLAVVILRLFQKNLHVFMETCRGDQRAAMVLNSSWRYDFCDAVYQDLYSSLFETGSNPHPYLECWLWQSLNAELGERMTLDKFLPYLEAAKKEPSPVLSARGMDSAGAQLRCL